MNPIAPSDILTREAYEASRDELRRRVMARKAKRRVGLGDHATLHFETRETMLYQVHEMLRAEGSWERPGAVRDELEAYNPLVPDGRGLSGTLMFEYDDSDERTVHLSALVGVDRHLWFRVGDREPLLATFDDAQVSDGRISSVQYVRWTLDEGSIALLKVEGTVVSVWLDHPCYTSRAVLSEETRRELSADLE